jgi:hypothetical protein
MIETLFFSQRHFEDSLFSVLSSLSACHLFWTTKGLFSFNIFPSLISSSVGRIWERGCGNRISTFNFLQNNNHHLLFVSEIILNRQHYEFCKLNKFITFIIRTKWIITFHVPDETHAREWTESRCWKRKTDARQLDLK